MKGRIYIFMKKITKMAGSLTDYDIMILLSHLKQDQMKGKSYTSGNLILEGN